MPLYGSNFAPVEVGAGRSHRSRHSSIATLWNPCMKTQTMRVWAMRKRIWYPPSVISACTTTPESYPRTIHLPTFQRAKGILETIRTRSWISLAISSHHLHPRHPRNHNQKLALPTQQQPSHDLATDPATPPPPSCPPRLPLPTPPNRTTSSSTRPTSGSTTASSPVPTASRPSRPAAPPTRTRTRSTASSCTPTPTQAPRFSSRARRTGR